MGRGIKPQIKTQADLKSDISKMQGARNGGRVKCADIVLMVEEKYNRKYSQSGMYKILNRLGFSWITLRSIVSLNHGILIVEAGTNELSYTGFKRVNPDFDHNWKQDAGMSDRRSISFSTVCILVL